MVLASNWVPCCDDLDDQMIFIILYIYTRIAVFMGSFHLKVINETKYFTMHNNK